MWAGRNEGVNECEWVWVRMRTGMWMYSVEPVVKDEEGKGGWGEKRNVCWRRRSWRRCGAVRCVCAFVPEVMILTASPGTGARSWAGSIPHQSKLDHRLYLWKPPNPLAPAQLKMVNTEKEEKKQKKKKNYASSPNDCGIMNYTLHIIYYLLFIYSWYFIYCHMYYMLWSCISSDSALYTVIRRLYFLRWTHVRRLSPFPFPLRLTTLLVQVLVLVTRIPEKSRAFGRVSSFADQKHRRNTCRVARQIPWKRLLVSWLCEARFGLDVIEDNIYIIL